MRYAEVMWSPLYMDHLNKKCYHVLSWKNKKAITEEYDELSEDDQRLNWNEEERGSAQPASGLAHASEFFWHGSIWKGNIDIQN